MIIAAPVVIVVIMAGMINIAAENVSTAIHAGAASVEITAGMSTIVAGSVEPVVITTVRWKTEMKTIEIMEVMEMKTMEIMETTEIMEIMEIMEITEIMETMETMEIMETTGIEIAALVVIVEMMAGITSIVAKSAGAVMIMNIATAIISE
jgi:hypothetical protein